MDVSYAEAWNLWWDGSLAGGDVLLGVSIRDWGRMGKIVQLMSALTIVAEIVGPARLRALGVSMHGVVRQSNVRDALVSAWKIIVELVAGMIPFKARKQNVDSMLEQYPHVRQLFRWAIAIAFVAGVAAFLIAQLSVGDFVAGHIISAFTAGCVAALIIALLFPFVLFAAGSIGWIIDVCMIEPVAWILERKSIGTLFKVGSVVMLLVGFHFDLLAS